VGCNCNHINKIISPADDTENLLKNCTCAIHAHAFNIYVSLPKR
jgi:hypothetical protein